MAAAIFLVRHAAHAQLGGILSGRTQGVPLSADGEAQAARLAEHLARESVTAVQASPLDRTRATAQAIAARAGLAVELAPDLNEIDFGDWTGRGFDELSGDPAWDRWNSARATSRPPNGEAMVEAQARAVAHVQRAAAANPDAGLVLVSHCDIIRAIVAHYLGLPLDNLLRFDIDPASVTRLVVGDWGGRLISLNERVCV